MRPIYPSPQRRWAAGVGARAPRATYSDIINNLVRSPLHPAVWQFLQTKGLRVVFYIFVQTAWLETRHVAFWTWRRAAPRSHQIVRLRYFVLFGNKCLLSQFILYANVCQYLSRYFSWYVPFGVRHYSISVNVWLLLKFSSFAFIRKLVIWLYWRLR